MITALALGSALGFISAVPVAGPVSAVIFSYGLKGKYGKGRWIAFGAGLVEAGYTLLAFLGFTHFFSTAGSLFAASQVAAATMLAGLGVYFYRSKKMRKPASTPKSDVNFSKRAFVMGAGMSLVNPTLIATWTAAITTLYSMQLFEFTTLNSLLFSGGVCVGIVVWFSLMLKLMAKYQGNIEPRVLDKGLKAMGLGLITLAAWILFRLYNGL